METIEIKKEAIFDFCVQIVIVKRLLMDGKIVNDTEDKNGVRRAGCPRISDKDLALGFESQLHH